MAGTLVGGALLSSFLNVLFDKMASRQFVDFFSGSGKENNNELLMRELKMKLLTANKLVHDAEEKQMTSPMVKKWLDYLKDAVFVAGDLLDEINTEALRRKVEGDDHSGGSSTRSIRSMLNSISYDEFDKTLEPKIVEILQVLRVILNEKDGLGLKEEDFKDRPEERRRQTTSRVNESGVFGRKDDKEIVINLLCLDDTSGHKIGVLPIVGMGGVGKTTLAQLVYKDVKGNFDIRAWIYVGEEFDILKIAQTIYERISGKTCCITDLDLLSEELERVLRKKKFLFILDDVWSDCYILWNELMNLLNEFGVHGSKIILTTGLAQVASKMGTLAAHHLRGISKDDSWLLFSKHAFTSTRVVDSHPYLEVVGRQIAEKCRGLPLAAKSLGGLLRSVLNPMEWEKVLKSDIWELPNDKILPALWLSYHYLPAHLKRCFAYCAIFPKDYEFVKSDLILLWMAEDLLQPSGNETMEEVGNDYFNILLSRYFFQPSITSGSNGVTYFTMHDLINDLAKFVSGEFCLRLDDHQTLYNKGRRTRHFSFIKRRDRDFEKFETLHEAKYLHTFLPLHCTSFGASMLDQVLHDLLSSLRYLRVLDLSWYDTTELPNSIDNLKHLRHLDLSWSPIKELPDTVCTLYNLRTLLLFACFGLTQLPAKLGRLINLRHLDISSTNIEKMPPDMGNLKHLQTLSDFVVPKCNGHSIVELKKLQHLGKALKISGLGNIIHDRDELEADIVSNKQYLSRLDLIWGGDTEDPENDEQVLDKLKPHVNLKELVIECYGCIRFTGWLGHPSFSNLSSIELSRFKHCTLLPPLGQLPSLRKLYIVGLRNVVEIGTEFYGNDTTCAGIKPFRSLEELTFEDMLEWQEWSYGEGSQEEGGILPNLRRLTLWNCPKLTKILPLYKLLKLEKLKLFGSFTGSLSHPESEWPKFVSLSSLLMYRCPKLVCFPNGGMDAPKLEAMQIFGCEKLGSLPEQILTLLPSLQSMTIQGCPELK